MEKKYLGLKTYKNTKQNSEDNKGIIGIFILFLIIVFGAISDLGLLN